MKKLTMFDATATDPPTPPADLSADFASIRRQYRVAAAVALGLLSGGAVFFHLVEHFSWVDSFYFCTMTLATVGYGDFVPHTTAGKLFDSFYVLIGIGIIAFFVNIMVKQAVMRRELRRSRRRGLVK
jgi:voltage-gated potassium channel Kch